MAPPEDRNDMTTQQTTILPPPLGIPLPPPLPDLRLHKYGKDSVFACGQSPQNALRGLCVPQETVDLWDSLFIESINTDTTIRTNDGCSFGAHSIILVSASSILRNLIELQRSRKVYTISMSGVPISAARVFVRFLYSSRYDHTDMEKYILHLLVLSHVYAIPALKKLCTLQFEQRLLTFENVIDVFLIARLCDAPRLSMVCLRLIIKEFKTVVKTEGWRVMRDSDPILEQELVEAVVEADSRRQERLRKKEEEKVYGQLRDAMDALVHICRDGCRTIGPHDKVFDGRDQGPCIFPACRGLECLVRHFSACNVKVSGGCVHCKRMWQILELHSRVCQCANDCKVPLCRHFKEKIGQHSKKEEHKWKLLACKVMAAKSSVCAFSLAAVSAKLEQDA